MFFDRGVLMGNKATDMAGHALAFAKGLHGVGRKPDFEFFALEFVRHAVVVIVDFDVVVDADGGDLPLGVFVGFVRQWLERWADRRGQRVWRRDCLSLRSGRLFKRSSNSPMAVLRSARA